MSTRMPPRDWHLRTRDFLAVRQSPEITITVDDVTAAGSGAIAVSATVTVRSSAAPVRFSAHWHAGEVQLEGRLVLQPAW